MWKKVVAPTLLVSVLWIATSVTTTYSIHRMYESHTRVLEENVSTIQIAGALKATLWRLQAVVLESAGKEPRESRIEAAELETAFEKNLEAAQRTSFTDEERLIVNGIRQHYVVYRDHIRGRLKASGLGNLLGTLTADNEKTMRLARAVAEPCQQLLDLNQRMLNEATAHRGAIGVWLNMVRLGLIIAGPIVGVLCGLWVARGLHRSISQISVTLKDASSEMEHEVGQVEVSASADLPALQGQAQIIAARIRQIIEQLQEARRQAMQAERLAAVGELAAGLAHEIRNPLTSIKLLIQTAAQRRNGPGLNERQIQVVQQEIARMESTIQGLLDFARPPRLNRVRHDVRATVQRALNLVEGRAKQQQVVVRCEISDLPVFIDGDPEQLHQVFVNLLLNGIESMQQGGALQVLLRKDDDRRRCQIVFCDAGEGIPQPVMDRIFEPFITSKEHGTGLGLAVSRRIVQQHGGELSAANCPEGGAVFTVELPLGNDEANDTIRSRA